MARKSRVPSRTGHLMAGGIRWHRTGTNIDRNATRALLADARLVVRGEAGGFVIHPVPEDDRVRLWAEIRDRFDGPGGAVVGPAWPAEPVYTADRYEDDAGRTLLYLETHC